MGLRQHKLKTPLHYAAFFGCFGTVKLLIARGARHLPSNHGFYPLHYACGHGHVDSARLLLESGVDVDVKNKLDGDYTSLGYAISLGRKYVVRLLLNHGAPQSNVSDDLSALQLAIERGHIDILELLTSSLDLVQLQISCKWSGGVPVLNFACVNGRKNKPAVIKWLIDRGCAPNGKDEGGSVPMRELAAGNDVESATVLLQGNGDVNAQVDRGWRPIHYATSYGSVEMVRFLLENGTLPSVRDEYYGRTPLDNVGILKKTMDGDEITEDMKEEIRGLLISYGGKSRGELTN